MDASQTDSRALLPVRRILSSHEPSGYPIWMTRGASTPLPSSRGSLRRRATQSNLERSYPSPLDDNSAGRNENLSRSGLLGLCNDPYCTDTVCPGSRHHEISRISNVSDDEFHNMLHGDTEGRPARRFPSFLCSFIPDIMNTQAKVVQIWNKFFGISCLIGIPLELLFFFSLSVSKENKCMVLDLPMMITIVVLRSLTDFIRIINTLIQSRLRRSIAPESRVVEVGDPTSVIIAPECRTCFHFVVYVVTELPIEQIYILLFFLSLGANYTAIDSFVHAILIKCIQRLWGGLYSAAGLFAAGLIFGSVDASFAVNILTFLSVGHSVGSIWYYFGLQRVNQCLRDACHRSNFTRCDEFTYCGHGDNYTKLVNDSTWKQWRINANATACLEGDGFSYGIFLPARNLTTVANFLTRYTYSLFWGCQQIITLAANLVPSYSVVEIIFTMSITICGLYLVAQMIGDTQSLSQALQRSFDHPPDVWWDYPPDAHLAGDNLSIHVWDNLHRTTHMKLEMSVKHHNIEQWMSYYELPSDLRRQVRQVEQYNYRSARLNHGEHLLEDLPEDLQRKIRRHLFNFITRIRILQFLDEPIIDAICERIRIKTYVEGSEILYRGGLVDKVILIKRGKMVSIGNDLTRVPLSEGEVCGEELLIWCLEHSSVKDGRRLFSRRAVICLTNVEAFVLRAADFEEVTSLFARFFTSPRVQAAIRYESPYWRGLAARKIQDAWRKKQLSRLDQSLPTTSS